MLTIAQMLLLADLRQHADRIEVHHDGYHWGHVTLDEVQGARSARTFSALLGGLKKHDVYKPINKYFGNVRMASTQPGEHNERSIHV